MHPWVLPVKDRMDHKYARTLIKIFLLKVTIKNLVIFLNRCDNDKYFDSTPNMGYCG